jgi:hypothetical protein
LFTFHKHQQRQEVTRPREIAMDSTFLTGLYCKQTNKQTKNAEIVRIAILENLRFLRCSKFD